MGSDGRGYSSQRQLDWDGKGCQRRPQRRVQCDDPCKRYAKGACARGDKCRFSHKVSDKSSGKGGKGKKAKNERDGCGKITYPPHWAKSCLEAASAQVAGYVVGQKFPVFAARDQTKQFVHGRRLRSRSAFGVSRSQTLHEKSVKVRCSVAIGDGWR